MRSCGWKKFELSLIFLTLTLPTAYTLTYMKTTAKMSISAVVLSYSYFQVNRPHGRGTALLCPYDRCGSNT